MADKYASASIDMVICLYHPCHDLISYSSSPVSCFAVSKQHSIVQRLPAASASSWTDVFSGA